MIAGREFTLFSASDGVRRAREPFCLVFFVFKAKSGRRDAAKVKAWPRRAYAEALYHAAVASVLRHISVARERPVLPGRFVVSCAS